MEPLTDERQTQWKTEFPGTTPSIEAMRESLILADHFVCQSQKAILQLQRALEPCEEPMHLWPAQLLRHYHQLKQHHAQDTRLRNTLLKDLQAGKDRQTDKLLKSSATETLNPKKTNPYSVNIARNEGFFKQEVHVRVIDGKTVTKIDIGRDHWLALPDPYALCDSWIRHYWFENAHIPPEYAFVLEHEGLHYPPTKSIFIGYRAEEFLRICQLEKDTNSEHALDGEHCNYQRLDNAKPIPPPSLESDSDPPQAPTVLE